MNCPFCQSEQIKIVLQNDLASAFYDKFPVNKGHLLIIPKRHVNNFFDITPDEKNAIFELLDECKAILDNELKPDGYNVGINCGEAAGQTVFHVHVHLIPRYKGDMDGDPRGGVRGVIPDKRNY
jgi:diadenosine tetraphosphate (Ap4A) HIT family hydrolase